jgi:hypothetical protein
VDKVRRKTGKGGGAKRWGTGQISDVGGEKGERREGEGKFSEKGEESALFRE